MTRQVAWRYVYRAALVCVLAFAWMLGTAAAQDEAPPATAGTVESPAPEQTDVALDGRALFRVRGAGGAGFTGSGRGGSNGAPEG
jgi:hypothetical protein